MPTCLKNDASHAATLSVRWPRDRRWTVAGALLIGSVLLCGCSESRVKQQLADVEAAKQLRATLVSTATESGTGDAGAAASTGSGWGTLQGRFVYAGTPGDSKPLMVDQDTEVCTKDGVKLLDRSLLVDPSTKGLASVVVFARKASRVKNPTPPDAPLLFDQKYCEFITPVFAARVGQAVDVHNSDTVGHNTNISGSSFNQLIPAGQGTLYKPDAETGMPTMVTCNIHPWMKAYAVFRKDGYVAVSTADGSFTIPDLPAGEPLELQVWHERSTGPSGALVIDKSELKWNSKGRFQVKLEADEVKDIGTIEVPSSALGG